LRKITGPELIELFTNYSRQSHKLFIPDVTRQEPIADSLVQHYDADLLEKGVKWYIDQNPGPFTVFDFATRSRDIVERLKYEDQSVALFKNIVAETKKRMEQS
jgi:hypothetical protein